MDEHLGYGESERYESDGTETVINLRWLTAAMNRLVYFRASDC